ncbi:NADP-dependent oxidoreductase domain-containing protein [Xylaria arbuscula]|nr:NADP-dependent oxidoreductase domain-containing protein [Xylaria arbuscula]
MFSLRSASSCGDGADAVIEAVCRTAATTTNPSPCYRLQTKDSFTCAIPAVSRLPYMNFPLPITLLLRRLQYKSVANCYHSTIYRAPLYTTRAYSKMNSIAGAFKPDSSGVGPKQGEYIPHLKLNDGHEIPLLAYGLGSARSKDEAETTTNLTVTAIKSGYFHLDGAESYKNETELGAAIKKSGIDRTSLFVTTKLQSLHGDIARSFAASLTRLGLDYVDLYLIHAPFGAPSAEHLQRVWSDLEAIRASGRARSIGVSNFSVSDLKTILATARTVPAINQIEYHPYLQHTPDGGGLLPFCRENGIAVAAYGPLTAVTKARPGPVDDVYAELARKYGVSEGEIAIRWCIDQGVVAVTTSANEQRLASYVHRLPRFKLTPREIERVAEKGREKHYRGYWTNKFAADDRR